MALLLSLSEETFFPLLRVTISTLMIGLSAKRMAQRVSRTESSERYALCAMPFAVFHLRLIILELFPDERRGRPSSTLGFFWVFVFHGGLTRVELVGGNDILYEAVACHVLFGKGNELDPINSLQNP